MDKSPLGRLSAELRNRIYELTLIYNEPIVIDRSWRYTDYSSPFWARDDDVHNTNALTQTCRLLREESTLLYYASNMFSIFASRSHSDADMWIPLLAEKLRLLGTFVVGNMKSFTLSQDGKRSVTFTPAKDDFRKMFVRYKGYKIAEAENRASMFDPVVDTYEKLGFVLEETDFVGDTRMELEDLQDTDARQLRDVILTKGRRFRCRVEYTWLGGAHLERPSDCVEVSGDSLGWRWKPFLKIFGEKGLEFTKSEIDEPQDEPTTGSGRELALMHYKRNKDQQAVRTAQRTTPEVSRT